MNTFLSLTLVLLSIGTVRGEDAFIDKDTGFTFPKALGALAFASRHKYDEPGAGYSLRYQDTNFTKADIYVYDAEFTNIQSGVSSKAVKDEFEGLPGALRELEKMGKYKAVKELDRQTKTYGPQKTAFLWVRFEYEQVPEKGAKDLGKRISEIFLTATRGKFIKIRLTLTEEGFQKHPDLTKQFMTDLSRALEVKHSGNEPKSQIFFRYGHVSPASTKGLVQPDYGLPTA